MKLKTRTGRRHEVMSRGVYLLPNLCTTASMFCGFFSVVKSLSGDFVAAAWAILLAGVFDQFDGRLARLANAESQFGVEYDSLVDLTSFGLAPGILMYTWTLYGLGKFGWLSAFLFFACGALRLARFNVQHDSVEHNYFQGLPIPTAAYMLATYVIMHQHLYTFPPQGSVLVAVGTMILALLMVSTIPYRSFKRVSMHDRNSFFALVGAVIGLFIMAIKPEITMFCLVSAYVLSGIVEELVTLRSSRKVVAQVMERRRERKAQLSVVTPEKKTARPPDVLRM